MPTHLVDLKNQLTGDVSICQTFAAASAGHEGSYIDMLSSDGPVFGLLQLGSVTGSGVDIDVKLQECATTDGTYTDVTNGAFTQSYTESTGDNVLDIVNGRRTARYVRAYAVIAGTTSVTSVPMAVTIVGQKKIMGSGTGYQS